MQPFPIPEGERAHWSLIWDLTDPNPTVDPCVFCDAPERSAGVSAFSIALSLGDVALKPARGMLRPCYFLAVSKKHVTSFSQLGRASLDEVNRSLAHIEKGIAEMPIMKAANYDSFMRVEHGSDNVRASCRGAGACIDHAHQHLVPCLPETLERVLCADKSISWLAIDSYDDIADFAGRPYMYVGGRTGHYVAPDPELPGQWVRRIISREDGRPDEWDWGVFPRGLNLISTIVNTGMQPHGTMLIDEHSAEFYPRG